jgi:hypothetical protein
MAEGIPSSQVGADVFDDEGEPAGDPASSQGRAAKYPCIKCKKNVGRNSVRCYTCQLWIHTECGGISKELLNILANPGKYGAVGGVNWNCDCCMASAVRLEKRMNALETRFQEVEHRMITNEGVMQDTTRRMDRVEDRQTRVEQTMEQERERMRRERAEEMREREIRRKNVVMHRVGEAGEGVKTPEERREWDLQSCNNIFKALNLNMNSQEAVKFCRRVGEKGEGPRPLIVGFRREWQKEDVLENAKHLRNTPFADTVIVPDLTQEQRKEEAEMISEAERRNQELTQEDKAKNLEWMVVGARGERRIVKGQVRARGAAGAARGAAGATRGAAGAARGAAGAARGAAGPARGAAGAARGAAGAVRGWTGAARGAAGAARGAAGAATGATLAPELLPQSTATEPWDPLVGGRGTGRGRGRRPSTKRTRAERMDQRDEYEEEDEEEMEYERQAPPQPAERA